MARNPAAIPDGESLPPGEIARDSGGAREQSRESWGSYLRFVGLVVLAILAFRSFLFAPFTIPSESMLPRLMVGDYLVAAKWPYGYSRLSLPFAAPLISGRAFADLPERGDIAIFKHPVDGDDYIKRVIALPGDRVALRRGRVVLNGSMLKRRPGEPFPVAISPNTGCHPQAVRRGRRCAYPVFDETLPGGRAYPVIDLGESWQDNFGPVTVPPGRLFVMGDNRDNSMDSRFAERSGGGVGLVSSDLLVGRASMVLFSTDGSAEWIKPWTWFTAVRWNRIGTVL